MEINDCGYLNADDMVCRYGARQMCTKKYLKPEDKEEALKIVPKRDPEWPEKVKREKPERKRKGYN